MNHIFFSLSLCAGTPPPLKHTLSCPYRSTLNVSRTASPGYSHPQHAYAHSHSKAHHLDPPSSAIAGNPWISGISPPVSWVPRHAVSPSAVSRHRTLKEKKISPGTRGKAQEDRKDGKWLHRSSRYPCRMRGWARCRRSKTNGSR